TVKALDAAGDRVGAIQHARQYQQAIRSELDVDPDSRIEQFITSLSTHRSPVEPESWIQAAPHGAPAPTMLPVYRRKPGRSLRALALTSLFATGFIALIIVLPGARDENPPSVSHSASRRQVDPEAKASYRRGLDAWSDRSKDGLDSAVIYFRRAIEIDPLYADAYGGLASAYVLLGYSGYRPSAAMFPKSRAAAFEAIKLDSALAAPYAALGMELTWERKFSKAENSFQKAIAIDPRYATAHQWYGILLMIVGRVPEAVTETGRAAELDPLSLQIQNNYATFLSASGDRAAATRQYQKMIAEEPDSAWVGRNPWLLTNMSSVYAANGKFDAALRAARRAVEIAPRHPRSLLALASVYLKMGQPESARRIFARADSTHEHYYGHLGLLYVSLGKPDSAFAAFDRVSDWGIPLMISLRNPRPLWNDPRYVALLERLGMPVISTTTGDSSR
ncbi:MAG: tetratricopeptide repeat protein, partial [Gemmatimonadales bacterium]